MRRVEIQTLWISALRFLGRDELAERALASVRRYFRREDGRGYFDCLAAAKGCTTQAWSDSELLRVWLEISK